MKPAASITTGSIGYATTCTFSGPHFAEISARWKVSGDEAIRTEIAAQKMPNGRVASCNLPHDYELFGRIEEAS